MGENLIETAPYNVFFIADLHLRHKNILRHQPQRVQAMGLDDENDIDGHDKYIIEMFMTPSLLGRCYFVVKKCRNKFKIVV